MAGENLENTVEGVEETPDTSKELAEINASITSLQQQLKESSKSAQEKIELSKKISDLEEQKNSILKNSQTEKANLGDDVAKSKENLKGAVSEQQQAQAVKQIANSDLSTEDKEKAQEAIKTNNFSFLDEIAGEGGILAIIMSIFKGLFGGDNDSENSDFMAPYVEGGSEVTNQTKLEFAKQAKKEAQKLEEKYGIPWEISLAQCTFESGWGQSKLAREHGNYFGVKGKGVTMMTKEDYGKGLQNEMASFRTYKNMEESFEAYAQFLLKNPRYRNAFNYGSLMLVGVSTNYQGRDPIKFLIEISKAGYATDTDYFSKVKRVMNSIEKSNV